MPDLSRYRKGITAAVGFALVALNAFFPGKYDEQIAAAISLLTAIGVYAIPNEPAGE